MIDTGWRSARTADRISEISALLLTITRDYHFDTMRRISSFSAR